MIDIAVVLLNWNGKQLLEEFVPNIIQHSVGAAIYVIDNGSTDDSISFLENDFPQVTVIKLDENKGFCEGYNFGLQDIKEEYYVLINTDVEVTAGWLDKPMKILKNDPEVGICQPKILAHKDRETFEYAGAAGGFIDSLGYPFCRGRVFESIEKDTGQYNDTVEVFWATGACLFIKSSIFHQVKGFDSGFFAHMEEIDLCWRVKNLGYKVLYCGESTVYHVGGATLTKSNPRKTFLNFRNSLLYLVKNLPAQKYIPKILARLVLDGAAALYFLYKGDIGHSKAVFNAHMSFYYRFWQYRKKESQKKSTFSPILKGSVVFEYFIKGKKKSSQLQGLQFPNYRPLSEVTADSH